MLIGYLLVWLVDHAICEGKLGKVFASCLAGDSQSGVVVQML